VAAANPATVTLYAGILGTFVLLVTGASAIAEERVLGTLEWQWTQPIPMARQWKIKVGVATALALTLGLVLPAALVWLGFDAEALDATFGQTEQQPIVVYVMALVALFGTSLYASSVSQSSMKAVALTPLLLASLWAIGALMIWSVTATLDQQWGNLWYWWMDLDELTDPGLMNQKPPAWLPAFLTQRILQRITEIGAIGIGWIWVGFLFRNARFNAQRLRSAGSAVWRQWGRLVGALFSALLLGGLLLIGLSRERAYYDQLSSFKSRREAFIEFATKAEREGKFTPEYLSPLGITNRPAPEALVDTLIRQQGFRWLSQDFVKHFQRKPVVGSHPRFLMDPGLARRYGLQTQPTTLTPPGSTMPLTNPASPESANSAPVPMMSQELMKRYGLQPRRPSRSPTPTPPKTSTNPPANPAPGQ
jgi:hypothetical protein